MAVYTPGDEWVGLARFQRRLFPNSKPINGPANVDADRL